MDKQLANLIDYRKFEPRNKPSDLGSTIYSTRQKINKDKNNEMFFKINLIISIYSVTVSF